MPEERTFKIYECDHEYYDEYDTCVECGAPCQILTVHYAD